MMKKGNTYSYLIPLLRRERVSGFLLFSDIASSPLFKLWALLLVSLLKKEREGDKSMQAELGILRHTFVH